MNSEEIVSFLKKEGASLVGIADVSVINKTHGFSKKELKKYPRAISIGVQLSDSIINEIADGPTEEYAQHYRDINSKLDKLSELIAERLRADQFLAQTIPSSKRYDQKKLAAIFPHKTAAILSGLGWIGKSALLITKELGPRLRLTTVLTNAPLEAGQPQKISKCGKCMKCVEACPVSAIKGVNWSFGVKRSKIFDAYKCMGHTTLQKERLGETICGICVSVCPHGKK